MKEMTIKEVQQVSLEILKDIHEFCVENDIHYSLSGGSLLGAVRHDGFIPWDDDVDIQMAQPDYYRFIHSYKSKRGYRLFSPEIRGCDDVKIQIAHVCDMEKTYVDQGPVPWTAEKSGIWVEIIPVYGAPDNIKEMQKHLDRIIYFSRRVDCWKAGSAKASDIVRYPSFRAKAIFLIKKMLSPFYGRKNLVGLIATFKKYDFEKSSYFIASPHYKMREWQPKVNMESYVLHKFEDAQFYIMSGYKENLTSLYGSDYMDIPPVEKRTMHYAFKYYWK